MKSRMFFDVEDVKSSIDERIYGSFVEHMGRSVYGGIYDPHYHDVDSLGFRNDVKDLVKSLDIPIIRYPGGNFVSNYDWMDGIGPREERPARLDLAWQDIESNEVGLHEFYQWSQDVDAEIMYAVNVGTKGLEEACNILEYCNFPSGTYWSDLRIKNGAKEPFKIKTWCIGNEMDGPWQIGHLDEVDYAKKTREIAKAMKLIDEDIELVAVGSSGPNMPKFGEWEYEVLMEAYDYVDYVSLHSYFDNKKDDIGNYLAQNIKMDEMIGHVTAICDLVKHKKGSDKTIHLSFDEWNVWYHSDETDQELEKWTKPRPILEDLYNFEDAVLVGALLNTLINNSDRVKIACLAQLVNVIAPIRTEKDKEAWKQTIFYPFMYVSNFGKGESLEFNLKTDTYDSLEFKNVPYLDCSVVKNKDEIVVFVVNRSLEEDITLDIHEYGNRLGECIEHVSMHGFDLKETNSCDEQKVLPSTISSSVNKKPQDGIEIPKLSWNMLRFVYEEQEEN